MRGWTLKPPVSLLAKNIPTPTSSPRRGGGGPEPFAGLLLRPPPILCDECDSAALDLQFQGEEEREEVSRFFWFF